MANFLEDLGRTNALPQAIQTLENRAITDKEFALRNRQQDLQEAKFNLESQQMLQQQKRDNQPIPTSTLQNFFKVPSVYNYAKDIASSLGYLEDTGGVETISRKDATQVFSLLQSKEYAPKVSQMRIRHWATQRDQLKAALAQAQEKGNEKNISKLGQALAGAEQQLSLAVSQHKDLDQYFDLIGKGYAPEKVQRAIETGDLSQLGGPVAQGKGDLMTAYNQFRERTGQDIGLAEFRQKYWLKGEGGYNKPQLIDDNRSHYDFLAKKYQDPLTGLIRKEHKKDYDRLISDYKADAAKIAKGQQPSWLQEEAPGPEPSLPGTGDRVSVIDPEGNVGTIPRSQLQEALQQGYKEQ